MAKDVRWVQRFQNYESAFKLLQSALQEKKLSEMSLLEQEGVVQRFEYTWELTWKLIKDYLEVNNVTIELPFQKNIIKAAAPIFFEIANIDGDTFIKMADTRNKLSHIYDFKTFQQSLKLIETDYLPQLENLYLFLKSQAGKDE
jgi:nucleotidyltransferase substrate binding protein (TIGR01987 family)